MLTQARVRELFDYRENGVLLRKIATASRAKVGQVAGGFRKDGYGLVSVDSARYLLHRVIFLWHHGWLPEEVDHKDLYQTNNRIENLRPATHSNNGMNKPKSIKNTSGYKGVSWSAKDGVWVAAIKKDSKTTYLGGFASAEDASLAYQAAAKKLHGEFACF